MQTITAVIPAKNEEQNIVRCIESVSWCDEIIVMWMGSDKTGEIAKKMGAKVVEKNKKENDDFKAVQENINWAIDNCKTDWILRIDADEVVSKELKEEIQSVILSEAKDLVEPDSSATPQNDKRIIAYGIPRKQYFWGGFLKGGDWAYDRLIRLFRPANARYNISIHVHEQLEVNGKTANLTNALYHYSHPTLADAARKFQAYTDVQINDLNDPVPVAFLKTVFIPPYVFLRWMIWHKGYVDGLRGLVAAAYRGWYEYLLYSKYLGKKFGK